MRSLNSAVSALLLLAFCQSIYANTYSSKIVLGPFAGKITVGPGMNASKHRLWGSEIVGQNLRGACFDDCDLNGVIFRQCDFKGATFRRAVLTGMTLDDCEWGENSFEDAVINGIVYQSSSDKTGLTTDNLVSTWSFKNKNLSKCTIPTNEGKPIDFTGFDLYDATLVRVSHARFDNAKLIKTVFDVCDLTGSVFDGATIDQCSFVQCKLDFAQLNREAKFLLHNELRYVQLVSNVEFSHKYWWKTLTIDGDAKVNLTNASIFGLTTNVDSDSLRASQSYKIGNLSNMTFQNCDLSNVDFSRQLLVGTKFSRCKLTDCNFTDAVITFASFEECSGMTPEQFKSTWNHKSHRPTTPAP